jgi:hypothetical protein
MSTIGPVMDAIGLVAGSLGIFNFAKSNLPSDPSPNGAVFKVKVGHQYEDLNYVRYSPTSFHRYVSITNKP